MRRYGAVAPGLYKAILNRCVDASQMCMDEMMMIDASGGLGLNRDALMQRRKGDLRGGPVVTSAMCVTEPTATPNWGVASLAP